MGIEISKYSDEKQATLKALDVNKDGVINEIDGYSEEEISAFSSVFAKYEAPVDTYTTNLVEGTTVDPTAGMTNKQVKIWNKSGQKALIDALEYYVNEGGTREDLVETLKGKNPNLNPEYVKAINEVLAVMPKEFASTKEVGKKHKEMERALENAGIKDDLHKKILKQLEEMAKNECRATAMADIAEMYENAADETKTPEQVMETVKQQLKSDGKFNGDLKDAFNNFSAPARTAYITVMNVIAGIDETKFTNGKKVQKEAERILKENGQWDKYTKKALYGDRNIFKRVNNWARGYRNDARVASDVQARRNNVAAHTLQSNDDVYKALGKNPELLNKLQAAGLIKNVNGKWDLSVLSEIIGNQVGSDYRLNREHSKDKEVAELANVRSKLEALQGLTDLSDSEAKALIKLCGYDIEGKNIGRAVFGGVIGALSGAAYGAAVGFGAAKAAESTLPAKQYIGGNEYALDPIKIESDLDFSYLKNQKLPEGVSIDATGSIIINIGLMIKDGVYLVDCAKLLGEMAIRTAIGAALPTALVGAAIGVLEGLKDKGQEPVLSVGFEEETYEDYCKMLEKGPNNQYAVIGKLIAGSFLRDDGSWDRKGYKDFLNRMAGNQNTLLNREELIGGLLERQAVLKNQKPATQPVQPVQPVQNPCSIEMEDVSTQETTSTVDRTLIYRPSEHPGSGWKEIVEAYYPCLVEKCDGKIYGPNGAIRALQTALATDEQGQLHRDVLRALYTANDLPKEIKLPLEIKGCERVDDAEPEKGNYKGFTETEGNGNKTPIAALNQVGRNEIEVVTTPGVSSFIARDCDGNSASGDTQSAAVQNLKEQTGKTYENENEYIK